MSLGKLAGPDLLSLNQRVAYWRLPVDPAGADQPYFWLKTNSQVYLLPVKRFTSLTNWLRTGRAQGHYFITDFDYGRALLPGCYETNLYLTPSNQRISFSPDLILDSNQVRLQHDHKLIGTPSAWHFIW